MSPGRVLLYMLFAVLGTVELVCRGAILLALSPFLFIICLYETVDLEFSDISNVLNPYLWKLIDVKSTDASLDTGKLTRKQSSILAFEQKKHQQDLDYQTQSLAIAKRQHELEANNLKIFGT